MESWEEIWIRAIVRAIVNSVLNFIGSLLQDIFNYFSESGQKSPAPVTQKDRDDKKVERRANSVKEATTLTNVPQKIENQNISENGQFVVSKRIVTHYSYESRQVAVDGKIKHFLTPVITETTQTSTNLDTSVPGEFLKHY